MPAPRAIIPASDLHTFVGNIFTAAGTSQEHADTIADVLVWANLRGVDSHGISRIPRYLELFDKGEANPRPDITVEAPRSAVAVVDAGGAPGPVALSLAMDHAVDMARTAGIAWVSVRGTVHTGAIGYYTSKAAEQGMAGLGIVAGVPNMAYPGSTVAAVATSPLSVAIPASRYPTVLLDMATAVIALGKIAQFKASGQPLPEGSAITANGQPTTDAALAAVPLPVGGAKGAGMSLVFEMLASGLTGNPIVSSFHSGTPEGRKHRQNAAVLAIDVSAFLPVDQFRASVDDTLDAIKQLPRTDPSRELLFPGERGASTLTVRTNKGVPVPVTLLKKLIAQAESMGADVPGTVIAEPAAS